MSFNQLKKKYQPQRKKFTHNPFIQFAKLERVDGEPYRTYITPDGDVFYSATSFLSYSPEKKNALDAWRKRIGEEEARKETQRAAERGTAVHLITEHYLNNKDSYTEIGTKSNQFLFSKLLHHINKIDNIKAQEIMLYSNTLQLAGTCDCIGEYNNKLSIIDFKTSKKPKKEEWIEDYFLQCTIYSLCVEEMYDIIIDNLVIIIACEEGESQVFTANRKDYFRKLLTRLKNWRIYLEEIK